MDSGSYPQTFILIMKQRILIESDDEITLVERLLFNYGRSTKFLLF